MKDIDQLKDLWKRCFGDVDAFIDLYFDRRYTPDNTDLVREDGRIVAQLQRIAYPLYYKGMTIGGDYISGVCTDEAVRNRGIMSRLLATTHRRSFECGQLFTFLIPAEEWLKSYYARFGYAVCFYSHIRTLSTEGFEMRKELPRLQMDSLSLTDIPSDEVFDFFHAQLKKREVAVLHPLDDLMVIMADLALAGGSVWVGRRDGAIVCLAFAVMHEGKLMLKELLSVDARMEESMVGELIALTACRSVEYPSAEGTPLELGMARAINVKHLFEIYALTHPKASAVLHVVGDAHIPENNGGYRIANGRCERMEAVPHTAVQLDISGVMKWLFASHNPHMSLMLN